ASRQDAGARDARVLRSVAHRSRSRHGRRANARADRDQREARKIPGLGKLPSTSRIQCRGCLPQPANNSGEEPMSAFPPFAFSGSEFRLSRRGFIGGAAGLAAALPAAPLWADVSTGTVPGDVTAIGLSGQQVTLTAAEL